MTFETTSHLLRWLVAQKLLNLPLSMSVTHCTSSKNYWEVRYTLIGKGSGVLYSHLSNKRGVTIIDLKKNPPSTHISTLHVYWFLRFFPPSTPRLLQLSANFFQKIPPSRFIPTSTFIDFATFAPLPCLFQLPRLLERWEYLSTTYHKFANSILGANNQKLKDM